MLRSLVAAFLALSAILVPTAAHARLQCVAYARQVGEVQIRGNARDWWDSAEGVYARGQEPVEGAVLAFRGTRAMPYGHVAVVSKVIDARRVLIDHANWSGPGLVERGVMAVDVSSAGDWSDVRVWYGRTRSLGQRTSPTFGFIYPAAPRSVSRMAINLRR